MELATWVSIMVEVVNVMLLLVLVYIYVKNHLKIRSKFTLGLLSFASLFLLERFLAIYFYMSTDMCSAIEVARVVRPILSSIETIGLAILLLITWK
ncbi:MAG: hypothetical protein HA496_02030 [Thaumarchaeota archaeon]|jgi:hypothetical protein|nr:hypothetical protein [Nitrososphaerota archaeon]